MNAILPKDCKGCFEADGGGMTEGLGHYLFKERYKGRMVGDKKPSKQGAL